MTVFHTGGQSTANSRMPCSVNWQNSAWMQVQIWLSERTPTVWKESNILTETCFYSLGNFIFGQNIDRSAAVKVTVTEDGTVSYALIPVYASDGQTKQMDANAAPGLFSYMESISDNASVDEAGNISEK